MSDQDLRVAGGAGAPAAILSSKQQLERLVMASLLWEDNFYSDGKSVAQSIRELVPYCTVIELTHIVIKARAEQKLRKMPLFICVCMLKHAGLKAEVRWILPRIVTRADMILDFLDIYANENGGNVKPLSNVAIESLAGCFNKFNEYQYAKYNNPSRPIRFKDAMLLSHPKPNPGKEKLFHDIVCNELSTPETWEVMLSAGMDKKEVWTSLITQGKLGGLAFLRNLRNMQRAKVPEDVIQQGFEQLKSNMLLPINFISAALTAPKFGTEIEYAMTKSYESLPKLQGNTLFFIDVSGSMNRRMSSKSNMTRLDCAIAMVLLAENQCQNVDIICTAGNDNLCKHASVMLDEPSKGFFLKDQIEAASKIVGNGGIFTAQALNWAKEKYGNHDYDRIIVFSDSQDMDTVYDSDYTPTPFAKFNYICDVSSEKHGINYNGTWTAEISGWSEHFLTYINSFEGLENKFFEE